MRDYMLIFAMTLKIQNLTCMLHMYSGLRGKENRNAISQLRHAVNTIKSD